MNLTVDTLDIARRLEAKFDSDQAVLIAGVLGDVAKDFETKDSVSAAIATAKYQIILSNIAIAGVLFAALKLFG